jgi:hypothetical protein
MKTKTMRLVLLSLLWLPLAATGQTLLFSENFDSYAANAYLTVSNPQFQTWTNTPGGADDVKITDELASSGSNSVKFSAAAAQGDGDIVLKLDNKTAGRYQVSFKMYIGNQATDGGYFNMLQALPATAEWAFSLTFDPNLNMIFNHNNIPVTVGTYVKGTWLDILVDVNLDLDSAHLHINGVKLNSWQYSIKESGGAGLKVLAGINFYTYAGGGAGSTVLYYIDDVSLSEISNIGMAKPLPVEFVRIYPNPTSGEIIIEQSGVTSADLYTISGQLAAQVPVTNGRADISNLSPGIYTARILTETGVFTSRIVKQ